MFSDLSLSFSDERVGSGSRNPVGGLDESIKIHGSGSNFFDFCSETACWNLARHADYQGMRCQIPQDSNLHKI